VVSQFKPATNNLKLKTLILFMTSPSLSQMMEAGMHFGHQVAKRYPKMAPYIFGSRKGVNIINLEITQKKLEEACEFVKTLASQGKTILFVGTKKHAAPAIEKYAKECDMPFITLRWLGGTVTNFPTVLKAIKRYKMLKEKDEKGELGQYTKKEQGRIRKEIKKMDFLVGGISKMEKIPDALFVVDLKNDKTAFIEASSKKIPIVAICDTNVNPSKVSYVIPASDDSAASVELVASLIAEAVKEGKAISPKKEEKAK